MPIYAYRCASCGFEKDHLQKLSDLALSVCPQCGQASYSKQVTAAGFQLKGTGWYVTDFRGDKKPSSTTAKTEGQDSAPGSATEANASNASNAADTAPGSTKPNKSTSAERAPTAGKAAAVGETKG